MSARCAPVSFARHLLRAGVAGVAAVAVATASAQPASAEPVQSGTIGAYTNAACGWYPLTNSLGDLWDAKIVRVNLPSVSGVTEGQLVVARVLFDHPDADGNLITYRSATLYTYASPGQMTTSWTSTADYSDGITSVEDAPGESGYTAGDVQNVDTVVIVALYWATGGTFTGTVADLAQNAASPDYPVICNTGGTLA